MITLGGLWEAGMLLVWLIHGFERGNWLLFMVFKDSVVTSADKTGGDGQGLLGY